ncbi:hypothetical protein DLM85_05570 [Hymenobacter edaphi]|uniref:Uncharacterized protein n=1 Tax=Hymenobacter edaphi TaxID=2211146 RepID=A0A328BTC3_9BACT|nr:hypothetical protein DLM85_05570 [Hymenobacter edaphi]
MQRRLYLIVDPAYGEQLAALPTDTARWVVDSPQNTPVAHRLWQERPRKAPLAGLTVFKPPADTPTEVLLAILDTVDEHEGETTAGGGYAALEVIGCAPDADIEEALAELDLRVTERTELSFVATSGTTNRPAQSP